MRSSNIKLYIMFLIIFCMAVSVKFSIGAIPGAIPLTTPLIPPERCLESVTIIRQLPRPPVDLLLPQNAELAVMLKTAKSSSLKDTNEIDFSLKVVNLCVERGFYEDGRKIAFRVLEKNPKETQALFSIAYSFRQEGELEKALEYYLKIEKINSRASGLHNNLGNLYLEMDKNNLAIAKKEFELEMQYYPLDYSPYINRGILYRNSGDYENAFQDFVKAAEMGKNLETYLRVARFCQQIGMHQKEGKAFLEKALELNPDSWRAWEIKAGFYYNEKKYKQAEKAYLRSLSLNNRNITLYELCWTYVKMNKLNLAKEVFERAEAMEHAGDACFRYYARKYLEEKGVMLEQ